MEVETPKGAALRLVNCQPIRECETILPVRLEKTANGYIADFGVTLSGYIEVTLTAVRGKEISFLYSEELDPEGQPQHNEMDKKYFYAESPFMCDKLIASGGSCLLTEVPEMFGAEHLLMQRCESREVFDKTVALINDFKDYYTRHGQVIYENPSPGNKEGGITTLEEKSLGCVQKGGLSPVVDVLDYGDRAKKAGLSLLNGPGNDIVAITNLMAAGAHIILFTTGRGTPVGSAVPTVKIATNRSLAERKRGWIDFDASPTLDGISLEDELYEYVIRVAEGEMTKNEINGYKEISIFKDGVTL